MAFIVTNNRTRPLEVYDDIPLADLADHNKTPWKYFAGRLVDPQERRFVLFKGVWIDVRDTTPCSFGSPRIMRGWNCYRQSPVNPNSGLIFKFKPDEAGVVIGRYFL